ncbi:MAG: hypothetical protein GY913_29440 [Proteobacteria bacterium]|nr:hypothetical protein [Pseudomonadota bacterium]MCP4921040.1 hypothetical protein [Pseudomonadota bacterium]
MVFGESPLKDVYRRVVWGPYRRALGRLPAGTELRANRALGRLAHAGARGKRARVEANLKRAFPDRDVGPIVRATFENHFADQYISWTFARIAAGEGASYLRVEGMDRLERALEDGGAVLMHPHMGCAQLPLCVLGARGLRVHQVGGGGVEGELSSEGQRVTALRRRLEQDVPATIWDGARSLRGLVRALEGGDVVLSAVDGTGGGRELGRRLPRQVLGQTMMVPVGAVFLALKSGAQLLPLHTFFSRDGYVSRIGNPLSIDRSLPTRQALEAGADLVAAHLHGWLSAHPGDWHFWDEFEPGRFLA